MKRLAFGFLICSALATGCAPAGDPPETPGPGSSSPAAAPAAARYVLRVDRVWGRGAQPANPVDELPAESYRAEAPSDRWEVALDGSRVVLTSMATADAGPTRLEGTEAAPSPGSAERRFDLGAGTFAGGRFVLRGGEAELTVFGSGVPIVSSERGTLVAR